MFSGKLHRRKDVRLNVWHGAVITYSFDEMLYHKHRTQTFVHQYELEGDALAYIGVGNP